ncbi:protein rep [Tenacibaculum finnmarkense]|uniref:protein rep n=1 Tax=Tenacibaculum finnmarkense TaxID=2781243 RepID=UPI001EFA68FC|nr:protein rep [Tenacibaculum finnmarkense]MCG8883964.1 protein rep [Tenacibaculum finnmarkense]
MTKILQKRDTFKDTLQKKQWSKYVSKGIALSLMHYNPTSKLFKSYKNSSYCAETLLTNDVGRIGTTYCKNRWCWTCNRIKTARLINAYLPQLETLKNSVFVTLTLPTVKGADLKDRILQMEKTWRLIYKKTKEAKYKRDYTIFRGIRKAECTIRPNGYYHYHFHLIMDNWAQGEWLIGEWLKYNKDADFKAQDIRLANEFSFKELFKYAFKSEVKCSDNTNAKRYDIVFNALRGKRTYQAFGGIKAIEEDFKDDDLKNGIILEGMSNRVFKWIEDDWYDKVTGEGIVGLPIPEKVKNMISYPISVDKIEKKEVAENIKLDKIVDCLVKDKDLVEKAFGAPGVKVKKWNYKKGQLNHKQLELFKE